MTNIVNKYEIQLGPVDVLGIKWLENLIRFIKMGAEVKEGHTPKAKFPHHAWLTIETSELLRNEPGVQVFKIDEVYTREQLDAMDFPELREAVKSRGVKGRDRTIMTRQYLKATGQDAEAISKDKLVPKGGLVEEETSVEDTPSSEESESKVEENSKEKEE
jgi:hypothetical protein